MKLPYVNQEQNERRTKYEIKVYGNNQTFISSKALCGMTIRNIHGYCKSCWSNYSFFSYTPISGVEYKKQNKNPRTLTFYHGMEKK